MEEIAGAVLDASALLAYLQGESGSQVVQSVLANGCVMNLVNYAEVLSRLADAGESASSADRRLREQGLIDGLLELVALTEEDTLAIADLRVVTRRQGLSLGDRACLATGLRLRRPVITADRVWAGVTVNTPVHLIR